ncbi:MAG TPA: hypothetical protein VFI54_00955 [Solirubrobacteraceae bacterium]|nr:hypothetical protein [Solirubrobacteraceae bacterium]
MSLSSGLANAGYAMGTVFSVMFAQHLPQRRMLVVYASLLVIGSVLTAAAQAGRSRSIRRSVASRQARTAGDRCSGSLPASR